MSFITFLTALALVPSGLSIPICFMMLKAPCVCLCGIRTKRAVTLNLHTDGWRPGSRPAGRTKFALRLVQALVDVKVEPLLASRQGFASRGSTFFGRRSGLSFARAAASSRALVMQSGQRHPAGAASPGGTGLISPSPERSARLPGKVGSVDEFLDRPVQQAVPVQTSAVFWLFAGLRQTCSARIFTCGLE